MTDLAVDNAASERLVWRKLWQLEDGSTCFVARTSRRYGTKVWSPVAKQWSTSFIDMCGFCIDFDGPPCPHHPVDSWSPPPKAVSEPKPVKAQKGVPLQHMGKEERAKAEAAARGDGPSYLLDGFTTRRPSVRHVGV